MNLGLVKGGKEKEEASGQAQDEEAGLHAFSRPASGALVCVVGARRRRTGVDGISSPVSWSLPKAERCMHRETTITVVHLAPWPMGRCAWI